MFVKKAKDLFILKRNQEYSKCVCNIIPNTLFGEFPFSHTNFLWLHFIYAFIGWFFYVPWQGSKPATRVYWANAPTNWATWPGLENFLSPLQHILGIRIRRCQSQYVCDSWNAFLHFWPSSHIAHPNSTSTAALHTFSWWYSSRGSTMLSFAVQTRPRPRTQLQADFWFHITLKRLISGSFKCQIYRNKSQ